jgi:hypothetical protein
MTRIIEQIDRYSIRRADTFTGFEVYRDEGAAAVRCARIGYPGAVGIARARAEIERRIALDTHLQSIPTATRHR